MSVMIHFQYTLRIILPPYFRFQMRFTGLMATPSPIRTSTPTKDAGKIKKQEGAGELPWKRIALIAGPILVVLSKLNSH